MKFLKAATLKDVAREAGVSVITASRVVNKTAFVSPELQARVMEAIQGLGYRPNAVARSLKQQNSHLIGFVVSSIANSYFAGLLQALERVVQPQGYNVLVCSTGQDPVREREYIDWLLGQQVEGIVLNTTNLNDEWIADLSNRIPMVLVNRRINHSSIHADLVDSDNYDAGYKLARVVLKSGHRRIGLINGFMKSNPARERKAGFVSGLAESGIVVDKSYPYIYNGDFMMESGIRGTSKLLSIRPTPTALVVMNNVMCVGVLKELSRRRLRIPHDLSLCSFGTIDNAELFYVNPTVSELNSMEFGTIAGKMILERISDPSLPCREKIFPARLVYGNSVAEPKN